VVTRFPGLIEDRPLPGVPRRSSAINKMRVVEGPEIQYAEAVIDNGKFGTRTIRFETGRLARQAPLGRGLPRRHTMILSATALEVAQGPAGLFPLTVDVEELMYRWADSRLVLPPRVVERGCDPDLPADRPPAAPVVQERSNEIQVVATIMAYLTTCTTWSPSTRPDVHPIAGSRSRADRWVRVALIDGSGWASDPHRARGRLRHGRPAGCSTTAMLRS
jgi:polyribonucleotide nucleotidyltransferase